MRPPATPTTLLLVLLAALLLPAPARAQVDDAATRLSRALDDARLELTVTGDPQASAALLERLFADVLDEPAFDGQVDLLASIMVARAEAYLQAGDGPRAELSLTKLVGHTDFDPDPATAVALWEQARARADVQRLVADLRAGAAAVAAPHAGEIADTVAAALAAGDERTLSELGERAVPALVAALDSDLQAVPYWSQEPYAWLLRLGPDTGLPLLREHLASGRLVRAERALTAVDQFLRHRRGEVYLMTAGRSARLADEDLRAVILEILGRPTLWGDPASEGFDRDRQAADDLGRTGALMKDLLGSLTSHDAYDPELARAAGRVAVTLSTDRAREVIGSFQHVVTRPSVQPVWEALLGHEDALVRREAARHLARLPRADGLLGAVDDPDPAVREQVASWFVSGKVQVPVYRDDGIGSTVATRRPVVHPDARAVLQQLCRDPSRTVRLQAVKGLKELDTPLEEGVYERLAADEDARVRAELADLVLADEDLSRRLLTGLAEDPDPLVRLRLADSRTMPTAVAREVLAELTRDADPAVRQRAVLALSRPQAPELPMGLLLDLADDPDPQVRAQVANLAAADPASLLPLFARLADDRDPQVVFALDYRLYEIVARGLWRSDVEGVLDLLTRRRFDRAHPLGERVNDLEWWTNSVTHLGAAGRRTLVEWAMRDGGDDAWGAVTAQLQGRGLPLHQAVEDELAEAWLSLDDESLTALALRLQASDTNGFWFLSAFLDPLPPDREAFARGLLEAYGDRPGLALLGARVLAREGSPAALARVAGLLAAADAGASTDSEQLALVDSLIGHLPDDRVNGFLQERIADAALSDAFRQQLARSLRPSQPGDVELALAVVEHWGRGPELECMDRAVELIRDRASERLSTEWLLDRVRTPYGRSWLSILRGRRDPAAIPALTQALRDVHGVASWWGYQPSWVRSFLVDGLVSYLSDEAAEALLELAAEATTSEERGVLMDGVTRIQEWQDARAHWEQRLATRATRQGAVTELLAMLDDGDPVVRAEAARGLATLQAVEHLPRLVRMLKDEHPSVAAAARQALDALHAMAGGEGG